jgi:hypothetical protein
MWHHRKVIFEFTVRLTVVSRYLSLVLHLSQVCFFFESVLGAFPAHDVTKPDLAYFNKSRLIKSPRCL